MTAGDAEAAAFGVVAEGVFMGAGVEVTGLLLDATGVEADLPSTPPVISSKPAIALPTLALALLGMPGLIV